MCACARPRAPQQDSRVKHSQTVPAHVFCNLFPRTLRLSRQRLILFPHSPSILRVCVYIYTFMCTYIHIYTARCTEQQFETLYLFLRAVPSDLNLRPPPLPPPSDSLSGRTSTFSPLLRRCLATGSRFTIAKLFTALHPLPHFRPVAMCRHVSIGLRGPRVCTLTHMRRTHVERDCKASLLRVRDSWPIANGQLQYGLHGRLLTRTDRTPNFLEY